ncbi:glycoside hydrolase family 13 protein [Flagelloscypha sp. PMI_526]|nr:glycoside hydrolase family 13 protein [Flagelloscypha sp. PMI_526]
MPKSRKATKGPKPSNVSIPSKITGGSSSGSGSASPTTPKTPADEGIEFFQSAIAPGEDHIRVYELSLDADGGPPPDRSYIRLPPAYVPYIVRVSIEAGMPASRNGVFKTNFPLDGGKFGRDKFCERVLPQDFSKPIQVDLPISHAGAFVYWVEYDGDFSGERIKGREGYFNIDPVLRTKARTPVLSESLQPLPASKGGAIKSETVNLPLDGLSILTVVSKWMGPIAEWRQHFNEARERGYTMLHYTPLQERGVSDSPYSIRDQNVYDPSLFGHKGDADEGRSAVEDILKVARDEYGLLSLTDVVLNHTANDSPWLRDHPEAGFSPANSPHLTPALELDTALISLSSQLALKGLPTQINSDHDLDAIMGAVSEAIRGLNFWQYYVLDVTRERASVRSALETKDAVEAWSGQPVEGKSVVELAQIVRSSGLVSGLSQYAKRFGVHVKPAVAAGLIKAAFNSLQDPEALAEAWTKVVDVINVPLYAEWEDDTKAAIDGVKNRLRYTRLDAHGPRLGEISEKLELCLLSSSLTLLVSTLFRGNWIPSLYSLANNGWIWNADPLANFAQLPSKAYLRREVIVWGDCVKLRYGEGPQDNPWLWQHMTNYVTSLASIFDGFRIDNCHSTPLVVGTGMLDKAREENPDLYVCAELFTGNEEMDLLFVKKLGVNSLIRESGNGYDPKELSRLLYRHGVGKPIGSMDGACLTSVEELPSPTGKGPIRTCIVTPLIGSLPHALLYDLTHDNESPLDKRTAEDALSNGALCTFSYSAIGSVKGHDDLYPKLLNLVGEKRKYEVTGVEAENSGISRVKRVLNELHFEMVLGGFVEGHVHQENDYIILSRVQPTTQKGYVVVAHTAFSNTRGNKERGYINPVKLHRTNVKYILGAYLNIVDYQDPNDKSTLKGLPAKLVDIPAIAIPHGSDNEGPYSEIIVPDHFPPGSIMLFETQMQDYDADLDAYCKSGAFEAMSSLNMVDLNVVLHRAEGEERDATGGEIGTYNVPGLGNLTYCGLEGWMHPLRHIMMYNDLGHALCGHLRDGSWAMDYVSERLFKQADVFPHLLQPAQWFKDRFERVKFSVPPFMRPKYFALVISEANKAARRAVIEQCSDFIVSGHSFTHDLALTAVQMLGIVRSASLNPDPEKLTPSLAAGLPHFASGWARCWGRDVFISLRGLLLTTGNFDGAKQHILAFGSVLKHGLIPNLLDSLRTPRYNSRDSPWWFLQNIQDYTLMAPNGLSLLDENVKRRFPLDDTWVPWNDPRAYSQSTTLAEIIQEIIQRHAHGIHFREYNAGPNLDGQMKDNGFNIDIEVDWSSGLILGGNDNNCGTWMDKMGESVKAGTKGQPGTPRDGAPVEITGLLQSTLRWLHGLSTSGKFPFKGVQAKVNGQERLVTYKEWSDLLLKSFETYYYIPIDPANDHKYKLNPALANRRGIYKDVYGSGPGREWSDYQFRPNFPIAMTVAPELFNPHHALEALKLADVGLNYHNGPEWGWPLGYFLRAYLYFDTRVGAGKQDVKQTLSHLHRILLPARKHIRNDPWAGIPELTNENGAYCHDSCATQAWSNSTLLDFLEDVHKMKY